VRVVGKGGSAAPAEPTRNDSIAADVAPAPAVPREEDVCVADDVPLRPSPDREVFPGPVEHLG
jgi:hypothetical protein